MFKDHSGQKSKEKNALTPSMAVVWVGGDDRLTMYCRLHVDVKNIWTGGAPTYISGHKVRIAINGREHRQCADVIRNAMCPVRNVIKNEAML